MTDNRRRLQRHRISFAVDIYDAVDGAPLGNIVNIHHEGLVILSHEVLQLEKIYQLEMKLPQPINNTDRIPFIADCLWQSPASSDGSYWVGFKIVELSNTSERLIGQLIEDFGMLDS